MFEKCTDLFQLLDGKGIPCIGYGTWQTPADGTTKRCVEDALAIGYRHIDTAFAYGNETDVGLGIKSSGIKREDIFVTTKHWITERGYEKTIKAIDTSLTKLGLDYLDLYLIHWPCVEKVSPNWKEINASTWSAFEQAVKSGKIRSIGVSNFQQKHLEALNEFASIKPVVNQIEFHPGFTQYDTVQYCQQHGMIVEAWSPLGNGAVLTDTGLAKLASKYGKSVAQLCIRFALQCNVLPLPKSQNKSRMADNLNVFNFEISVDDMEKLLNYPTLGFSTYLPENAPADALVNNSN